MPFSFIMRTRKHQENQNIPWTWVWTSGRERADGRRQQEVSDISCGKHTRETAKLPGSLTLTHTHTHTHTHTCAFEANTHGDASDNSDITSYTSNSYMYHKVFSISALFHLLKKKNFSHEPACTLAFFHTHDANSSIFFLSSQVGKVSKGQINGLGVCVF